MAPKSRRSFKWWWAAVALVAAAVTLGWVFDPWGVAKGGGVRAGMDLPNDVCIVAPTWPYDPASGRSLYEARDIPPQARCPVCGMFPARAQSWAAQVIFEDGNALFFDSPLMLFLFLANVPRYASGREVQTLAARFVRDYDNGAWIDAMSARYVHGSRVLGPMRTGNLPAFADADRAAVFAREQGGAVLRASDLNVELLRSLDTRPEHAGTGHGESEH